MKTSIERYFSIDEFIHAIEYHRLAGTISLNQYNNTNYSNSKLFLLACSLFSSLSLSLLLLLHVSSTFVVFVYYTSCYVLTSFDH
jgi:hypothetical protein